MIKDELSYYHAYSSMFEKEKEMKLQNKHDKDDRWIYERNPDTGEIKKRRPGDYGNEQIVNPAVNAVPNIGIDYEEAALNLNGQEWVNFINTLTNEQKIKLSECWD